MDPYVTALFLSAGAVFLAEIGDKSLLLAMAFAAKYKAGKVMLGVGIATILNHALAVAVGHVITRFDSFQAGIQALASLSFIVFGLWTIRGGAPEGEGSGRTKYGAVVTVALAFFMAEMGDKTQLATIALAAKYPAAPLEILAGTTIGMLLADGIGIIAGLLLRRKIPERTVRLISAGAFVIFGFAGAYQALSEDFMLSRPLTFLVLAVLAALTAITAYVIFKKERKAPKKSDS